MGFLTGDSLGVTNTPAQSWYNAGTALQIGGVLQSGLSAYYTSLSQKSALDYQSIVAESNARLAERSAESTLLQGAQQANQVQLRGSQLAGTQRASFAASGVDLGEGSAARVQTDTEALSGMDAQTTYANAVRSAWGMRMQGTNYSNQALTGRALSDSISPVAAGAGSLLSGASSVATNWYRNKKAGG